MTFKGHKHNAKARAAITAGTQARWARFWADRQAAENEWAAANGLEPENVLNQRRVRRSPAEIAARKEAAAFNRAQRALDAEAVAQRKAERAELEAIKNGVSQ